MTKTIRALTSGLMLLVCQAALGVDIQYQGLKIPDQSGKAVTVMGSIEPDKLGRSLMHEHLFSTVWLPLSEPERWERAGRTQPTTQEQLDIRNAPFTAKNRTKFLSSPVKNIDAWSSDNLSNAIDEVNAYQELGGQTIVDVTNIGLGRKPSKLKEVSLRTNINIVMGTGFYRWEFHPEGLENRSISDMTMTMVRDIIEGVGDTDIRAGIIGEIPTKSLVFSPKESEELRVLRASARASRLTGASISLRCPPGAKNQMRYLHKLLDIIEEEGADLSRVALGHLAITANNFGYLETLLDRGVYLQYDTFALPYLAAHF